MVKDRKFVKDPAIFLVASGLLYEINRRVLHPVGLALQVEFPDDGGPLEGDPKPTGTIKLEAKIWDEREDPEGIIFEESTLMEGQAKFEKFMAAQTERLQTRNEHLGYVVQAPPVVKE
jgi:hypothetical protein